MTTQAALPRMQLTHPQITRAESEAYDPARARRRQRPELGCGKADHTPHCDAHPTAKVLAAEVDRISTRKSRAAMPANITSPISVRTDPAAGAASTCIDVQVAAPCAPPRLDDAVGESFVCSPGGYAYISGRSSPES